MAILDPETWEYVDSNDAALQIALESRLLTGVGEYVGLEGYGNTLVRLVGSPLTDEDRQVAIVEVTRSVDPIIDLETPVTVVEDPPGRVTVNINGKFDVVIQ